MMFASIGALFLSQGTITGSYQEIQQLICDQKMEDARAVALSKAQAGDADGFIALGWFEEEGKFSKADNTRAFAYYTTAATLGSAHAQWKVGVMLDTGSGVKQDPKAAVGWFRKSARQKLGAAWSSLGLMQLRGRGTQADMTAARHSYEMAIRFGEPHGYAGIGAILATGTKDMSEKYLQAVAWYLVAADNGSEVAREKLGQLPTMSSEQWSRIKKHADKIARKKPITVVPFSRACKQTD